MPVWIKECMLIEFIAFEYYEEKVKVDLFHFDQVSFGVTFWSGGCDEVQKK